MSYFPGDIPFMSKEELRENGIKIPKNATDTNVDDTISRQMAIDAIISFFKLTDYNESAYAVRTVLGDLPPAPPAWPKWISVEEKLPDEHDSIFKRFYGTNKWTDLMFLKRSDDVFVIEVCDGEKQIGVAHTCDGQWRSNIPIINYEVIAWMMPFPNLRNEDGKGNND